MTRAPRSASCLVANGADMACSTETTVTPVNGAIGHLSLARSREVGFLSFADGPRPTDRLRPKASLVNHHRTREGDYDVVVLVHAGCPHCDDADIGTRLGLTQRDHFRPRVNRVAVEHWLGKL